ncbi:hypothetical protein CW304_18335 [Bacillus sp. UFRGS-B20]|nr:hypothetical protein CW304_18335 [Bacillus sp. UFRGS-B20]
MINKQECYIVILLADSYQKIAFKLFSYEKNILPNRQHIKRLRQTYFKSLAISILSHVPHFNLNHNHVPILGRQKIFL